MKNIFCIFYLFLKKESNKVCLRVSTANGDCFLQVQAYQRWYKICQLLKKNFAPISILGENKSE